MPSVCFYFQAHQPYRVKRYRIFDIGRDPHYFNDESESNLNNRRLIKKVSEKCYLPTNRLILQLLERHPQFKVTFSLSGVLLEQLEAFAPEVLSSFQDLVRTGRVELLAETYYHSLAFLYSVSEFRRQIRLHRRKILELFAYEPTVFRHTELIYNNDLAKEAEALGFLGILAEGADHLLGWRSPNFVYRPKGSRFIKLLLKNYRLSDDIAFRFSSPDWSEWPLTAPKFASWLSSHNPSAGGQAAQVINLFLDYETFGEHHWSETGIFDFLRHLPEEILRQPDNNFVTVSEALKCYQPVGEIDAPHFVSWADLERDLSAWLGNSLQQELARKLYELQEAVWRTKDQNLLQNWRRLQTSDHFYYLCTKWFADGDVHKYFNPYESPYEAFISLMNVLQDLKMRIEEALNQHG